MARIGVKVTILVLRHYFNAIIRKYSRDRRVQEIINDKYDLGIS